MRKAVSLLMLVMLSLPTACAKEENSHGKPVNTDSNNSENPRGITYNRINYVTVSEDTAPVQIVKSIQAHKEKKGFLIYEDTAEGYIYIAVLSGTKHTGGYSIRITKIGDSEGKTEVTVEEKAPGKNDIVTQAFTYPRIIVRAKGITTNIAVKDAKGNEYGKLN